MMVLQFLLIPNTFIDLHKCLNLWKILTINSSMQSKHGYQRLNYIRISFFTKLLKDTCTSKFPSSTEIYKRKIYHFTHSYRYRNFKSAQKKLYQIRKVKLISRPCFPIMKGLDRTAYKVYNSRYLWFILFVVRKSSIDIFI